MRLNRRNLKKLASLSALGAGAVSLTAGKAQASIIDVPVNAQVGFSAGFTNSYLSAILPNSLPATKLSFFRASTGTTTAGSRNVQAGGSNGGIQFAGYALSRFKVLSTVSPGAVWGARSGFSKVLVGGRSWGSSGYTTTDGGFTTSTFANVIGHNSFANLYALFQYPSNTGPLYGWIDLSLSVQNDFGTAGGGPDVTIISYAIDTSGAQIAAGDTGTAAPEPASFALSGLGALALGAVGIRRWRAARQKEATDAGA